MISMPPSIVPAISAVASLGVSSHPRVRRMLVALFTVLAVLFSSKAGTASAQTAHFDGAQIASIYGTSALTGTNVVAIAVDAAGDVVFTTQNPASSMAFKTGREAHTIPAAYHPARRRQFSDGPRNATAQKVDVSSCTYSGVGNGLFIRPANSSTVYDVSGLVAPMGLTFDSAGNLYVLDAYTGQIYRYLGVNGSIQIKSFYGTSAILNGPFIVAQLQGNGCTGGQMATDALGNLYYTTFTGGAVEEIQAVNGVIPSSPTSRSLGSGFGVPFGIAVDSNENVYVADVAKNAVFELVAVNGNVPASPSIRTLGSGFKMPAAVGLDSRGDVYVSDYGNNALKEMVAINGSISSSPTIEVLGTFNETAAVTLDRSGNVFVGEAGSIDGTVIELAPNGANIGQIDVGSTSTTIPMMFTFDTAGTLGSAAVLTQGATGLDFANAGTGSCKANTAYATGQGCTVKVNFTPKFAGTRIGAVVLNDNNGNAIATAYLQGTGIGPQVIYSPALISTPIAGIGSGSDPVGVAVDASGNVYLANLSDTVAKIPPGCTSASCVTTLGGGFSVPSGVAVDGSGNVYVADQANNAVKKIPLGCANASCVTTLGGGFSQPMGVAVDGSGNVYVADFDNNAVKEMPSSCASASCVTTLGGGFSYPRGVAVDGNGNVYVGDNYNNAVKEIPSGCVSASCVTTLGGGFNGPEGVTVDGIGNVYIVDTQNGAVKEMPPGCASTSCVTTLGDGFDFPAGVAADGSGNVYVVDYSSSGPYEIGRAIAPSLTFPSTYVNATSAAQTVTITNGGNAPLNFTQITYPANFPESTSATNDCMTTTSLASNETCTLTIDFTPTTVGALSGSLVLTDNNLNAAAPSYATQTISLSGTAALATPAITWATPAPITYGTALSEAQLNATSTVAGAFSYSPAAGTVLGAGDQTLTATFTPTDTTSYTTSTATVTLTVNQATPVITWAAPAAITYGTPLSAAQLSASSTVAGTFTYSPAAGTVLTAGQQALTATFTPTDTADYTTASATVTLTANQATPAITWAAPAAITYGTPLSAAQLNASSTVAGTFTYSPAAGTVLTAGQQALTAAFTPADTTDYTAASATVTLTVNKATPAISWATPAPITYGAALSATQLNASSAVAGTFTYSPAAGKVLTAGQQTLTATFTPTNSANHSTATATVTLTVNKTTPTITWATPAAITYGTALSTTQLNAKASVPGTLVYSPAAGTVPAVGSDTLTVTFTPTDTTDYTTATGSVLLKVNPAPSFTLAASPASLTVAQGTSGKSTITVNKLNGFTGSVTLAASGLPTGVTATFATNPTTGSSVLTLTASSSAATGSTTVTIKGTSGSLTASTAIALTVSCTPTTIIPYISINGGSTWTQGSSATVNSTSTVVDLGPQPTSGGSWNWTGPNNFTSTARQINRIPLTVGMDNYVASYTNTSGCKSAQTFTITVK